MELAPKLKSQRVQNRVREVGINPNYWYPVAWDFEVQAGCVIAVEVWQMAIALYRDRSGQLHALEDACPHKGIPLHKGEVQGAFLACAYHGWEFDGEGKCVNIPYFPPKQKLPCAQVRSYPVREKYGIIFVFPGEPEKADSTPLVEIPEYDDDYWLTIPIPGKFQAHFSICNENTMDVFHGYLHRNLQGWFDPVLTNLQASETSVYADYQVSYRGWLTKFLGLSEQGNKVTTRTISIKYDYPHYRSSLSGISSIYLMRLPVGLTQTKSFAYFFLKVRLPSGLQTLFRKQLSQIIRHLLFQKFLDQDIEMMESEQRNYLADRERQYVEINPAIIALQRVIVGQYEKFMQQSIKPTQNNGSETASMSQAIVSE